MRKSGRAAMSLGLVAFFLGALILPFCPTAMAHGMECCKPAKKCATAIKTKSCCQYEPTSEAPPTLVSAVSRVSKDGKKWGQAGEVVSTISEASYRLTPGWERPVAAQLGQARSAPLFLLHSAFLC